VTDADNPRRWTHSSVKYYMYHILALQSARARIPDTLNFPASGLLTNTLHSISSSSVTVLSLPRNVLYTVADLESVSQSKKNDASAKSVMHLCGNKWCMNSGHYFVGSKIFNEQQAFCHKGLHNANTLQEYLGIQHSYCKHQPKCWAIPYGGEFDLTTGFCATGIPVVVDDEVE
jgi:hypothetical protein